jgi:hypothetical protein
LTILEFTDVKKKPIVLLGMPALIPTKIITVKICLNFYPTKLFSIFCKIHLYYSPFAGQFLVRVKECRILFYVVIVRLFNPRESSQSVSSAFHKRLFLIPFEIILRKIMKNALPLLGSIEKL